MPRKSNKKSFKLIFHNAVREEGKQPLSDYDDTNAHLTVGEVYQGVFETAAFKSWIRIGRRRFSSLCFEEVRV